MQFGNAPTARVYELIKKPLYPLDKLFTNDTDALTRLDGSQYYGTAWLLTHLFQHNPARGPEFKRYIDDMVRGVPDIAPDRYFSGEIAALSKELQTYIKRPITISVYRPADMPAFPVSVQPVEDGQGALILQNRPQKPTEMPWRRPARPGGPRHRRPTRGAFGAARRQSSPALFLRCLVAVALLTSC